MWKITLSVLTRQVFISVNFSIFSEKEKNVQVTFAKISQMKINIFTLYQTTAFKSNVVNRVLSSLHGGSLEITIKQSISGLHCYSIFTMKLFLIVLISSVLMFKDLGSNFLSK